MEWISVKDRLPNSHDWVLVCEDDGVVYIGEYRHTPKSTRGWYDMMYEDEVFGYTRIDKVTHWMPLPKPPNE